MMRLFRRLFLTVVFLLTFTSLALASGPFLVCKSYPLGSNQPTSFLVSVDDGDQFSVPITYNNNMIKIHWDISGLSNGTHALKIQAVNIQGASGASASLTIRKGMIYQSIVNGKVVQSQIY